MGERLPGGADRGSTRFGDAVHRRCGPWTPAVHALLNHLQGKGFDQVPRALGLSGGEEILSYLDGETVGARRPSPAWVWADDTLGQVGDWLRRYHQAVADFVPPVQAHWREQRDQWRPGMIIAHNDPAAYNVVWRAGRLVGFIDWDMAGPSTREDDLAWVAFSWASFHSPALLVEEGFTDQGRRRDRAQLLLDSYGSDLSVDELITLIRRRVVDQLDTMVQNATDGDETYRGMLDLGVDRRLREALVSLDQ